MSRPRSGFQRLDLFLQLKGRRDCSHGPWSSLGPRRLWLRAAASTTFLSFPIKTASSCCCWINLLLLQSFWPQLSCRLGFNGQTLKIVGIKAPLQKAAADQPSWGRTAPQFCYNYKKLERLWKMGCRLKLTKKIQQLNAMPGAWLDPGSRKRTRKNIIGMGEWHSNIYTAYEMPVWRC